MYPTVRAVADKPDRISSERIDPFARVRELAAPSKHPPRTDQLRPIAHVFPADLGAAYVWLQSQALGVYAMEENRSPFRSWVNSGKVQTEQMFSGLCLKADARRCVYVIHELLIVWLVIVQPPLAVYWILRKRQFGRQDADRPE
jgi:hypothetical protein